jgi:hypothetical protein
MLLAFYGGASYWAYFNRTHAFLYFALVTIIALPFVISQLIQRLVIGMVIGAVLTGISVAFPPAAILAAIIGLAMLVMKFQRFARNLPFLATSCGAYAFLWFMPIYVVHQFRAPGDDRYLFATALAAAGIIVLLLCVGLMSLMEATYARTILFTVGYGWYLAFFLLTLLLPDGDDGGTDWDDDR